MYADGEYSTAALKRYRCEEYASFFYFFQILILPASIYASQYVLYASFGQYKTEVDALSSSWFCIIVTRESYSSVLRAVQMLESNCSMWRFVLLLTSIATIQSNTGHLDSPVTAKVQCETTKGSLTINVHRDWAPLGADRFVNLVKDGFYTDIAFFRCVKGFLTQFGISDKPQMNHWHNDQIPDDPSLNMGIQKNFVSFAGGGANTRSTQIFIAFEYLDFLGTAPWETPFAVVVEGQSTLDNLYKDYGDIPPFGNGPDQNKIHNRGNKYVHDEFPLIDFLQECHVIEEVSSMVFIHPDDEKTSEDHSADRMVDHDMLEEEEIEREENGVGEDKVEEEEKETSKKISDEEDAVQIPRGPDELDRISLFEKKSRISGHKVAKTLREQILKSEETISTIHDKISESENDKKYRTVLSAIGFLLLLLGLLYFLHLQRASVAAIGKRS